MPEQRLNRTLVSLAGAMLQDSGLFEQFWQDSIEIAYYIRNRASIGPNGKTIEEAYTV